MCKDAGLVEYFLSNALNNFGGLGYTLIYYTGKRPLVIEEDLPVNVFIFDGRPKLEKGEERDVCSKHSVLCVSSKT